MQEVADNLEFELAADVRDQIRELRDDYDLGGKRDQGVEPEIGEF